METFLIYFSSYTINHCTIYTHANKVDILREIIELTWFNSARSCKHISSLRDEPIVMKLYSCSILPQASTIVPTDIRPSGQVTWKSTCPAAKPTCPAFLYDNVFSRLTNKGEMRCCLHLVFSSEFMLFWY